MAGGKKETTGSDRSRAYTFLTEFPVLPPPPPRKLTYAELSFEAKNAISKRRREEFSEKTAEFSGRGQRRIVSFKTHEKGERAFAYTLALFLFLLLRPHALTCTRSEASSAPQSSSSPFCRMLLAQRAAAAPAEPFLLLRRSCPSVISSPSSKQVAAASQAQRASSVAAAAATTEDSTLFAPLSPKVKG